VDTSNWTLEQLVAEVERQEREADRLLGISGSFAFVMDEEEIAVAVLREISDADVDRCVIAVFEDVADRDPAWLELVAQYDLEQGELGPLEHAIRLDMEDVPVMSRILRDKEPIFVPDLNVQAVHGVPREHLLLQGMSSVAIVPLIVMGWPIGALLIAKQTPYEFQPSELRYYQIVVNLAAMALRAVHLIEEQKRITAEQNAVNRVSQAITTTIHLHDLLELVYEQISTVIDATGFHIALYDPFHDEASFPLVIEKGERQHWPNRGADQGLTGYVLQTREPLLLEERTLDHVREIGVEITGDEVRSWMGVPMLIGDRIVGMMAVQDEECEGAYSEVDLNLLASLANQIAVAIENARLYEDVQHQATYLRLSAEVGRWITHILDVDELLSQVVELICTGFGYYHVDIGLIDAKTDEVVYRAGSSTGRVRLTESRPRLKVGEEGIIGWVAGNGRPLLVNDVHADPRYKQWVALPDTQSELAVPIKIGGQTIGVLNVESDERNAFHPRDVPMMYTLADQVAMAVQNARLFGERERRIRELDALAHVGQALCTAVTRDDLLAAVHEQVDQLMDADNFFLALCGDEAVHLALVYEDGKRVEPSALQYGAGEGLTGWVIENAQPLLIQDWKRDDKGLADRVGEHGALDTRAWLGVPIVRYDQVLGVIGVQSAQPDAFDEHHRSLLNTVAAQLAMALGGLPSGTTDQKVTTGP
jgi:GAF domain-containing protein